MIDNTLQISQIANSHFYSTSSHPTLFFTHLKQSQEGSTGEMRLRANEALPVPGVVRSEAI